MHAHIPVFLINVYMYVYIYIYNLILFGLAIGFQCASVLSPTMIATFRLNVMTSFTQVKM